MISIASYAPSRSEGPVNSLSRRTRWVIGGPWTKEREEAQTAWSSTTSVTWFEWNSEYSEPRSWRQRTRWSRSRWTWQRWCWREHKSNQAAELAWSWSRKGPNRFVKVRSGMFQVWQVRPLRKRIQIGKLLQLWQGWSYSEVLSNWKKRRKIFSQKKTTSRR